jgi:hypothetical protein
MDLSGGSGTFDHLKLAHRARTPGSPIGPDGEIDWAVANPTNTGL